MIWVGAARNSALATRRRLTSSHRASPPRIDSSPAKRRANTGSNGGAGGAARRSAEELVSSVAIGVVPISSIRHLRHARRRRRCWAGVPCRMGRAQRNPSSGGAAGKCPRWVSLRSTHPTPSLLPLTPRPAHPIALGVSRPDGRSGKGRKAAGEESPGSMDIRCRITSGGATPGTVPQKTNRRGALPRAASTTARVKWCGKSAPRRRQRRRHGKPHREQNRIGTVWSASPRGGALQDRCPNPAVRVGCSKRRATGVPEEWPSRARHPPCATQNPAYRSADL